MTSGPPRQTGNNRGGRTPGDELSLDPGDWDRGVLKGHMGVAEELGGVMVPEGLVKITSPSWLHRTPGLRHRFTQIHPPWHFQRSPGYLLPMLRFTQEVGSALDATPLPSGSRTPTSLIREGKTHSRAIRSTSRAQRLMFNGIINSCCETGFCFTRTLPPGAFPFLVVLVFLFFGVSRVRVFLHNAHSTGFH